tara:strand:+ start:155 stop:1150 length:996 start_codon:yes stop_codon:yes gene_type:complete
MKILKLCLISLVVTFLAGCATSYKVEPSLIKNFQAKDVPEDKTGVYVIRGSNFKGGGRGLWVAINDKVVADLPNGSHVYLELDAGMNTLHFVQNLAGFGYLNLDDRDGEMVFAKFDYGVTSKTEELEPELGKTIVMQTDLVQPLTEARKNDAYDNLLINPSAVGYKFMNEGGEQLAPDAEHAVVTFYRPDKSIKEVNFDIWNQDGFIGSTTGGHYFSVKLKAGEHNFLARSERYSVLKSTLKANKYYGVKMDINMGWNQAHIKLLPINLNAKNEVSTWKSKLKYYSISTETLALPAVKQRITEGHEYLADIHNKIVMGEVESRELPAEFGK